MTPIFGDMFAHMRWADRRALSMLRDAGDSAPEAWKLFCHILGAERIWIARILRRPLTNDPWPALTPEECEEWMTGNGRDLQTIIADDSPFDPDAVMEYRNVAGREFRNTLSDILIHLALHGMHHRGQIVKLLRQAGREVLPLDYIVFAREGKPS